MQNASFPSNFYSYVSRLFLLSMLTLLWMI